MVYQCDAKTEKYWSQSQSKYASHQRGWLCDWLVKCKSNVPHSHHNAVAEVQMLPWLYDLVTKYPRPCTLMDAANLLVLNTISVMQAAKASPFGSAQAG